MKIRALITGLLLWTVGTAGIRLAGQRLLVPGRTLQTIALYAVSFLLMALLIPRICRKMGFDRSNYIQAATLLILPTLLLDPFSCAFFTTIFPNVQPSAAGAFGGWMLICCGGGIAGVWRQAG